MLMYETSPELFPGFEMQIVLFQPPKEVRMDDHKPCLCSCDNSTSTITSLCLILFQGIASRLTRGFCLTLTF